MPPNAGYVRRCGTARGSDRPDIDIHLLVDPAPGSKLLDCSASAGELDDELGVKVDIGAPDSLRPSLRDEVLVEAVAL